VKERIAEKIDGLIVGRKRDGRNIYSSAGKRALIHACLQPGISVAGSALANGINANLLRKWIQRYQGRQSSKKPMAKSNHCPLPLLPIQLTEPSPVSKTEHNPPPTIELSKTVEVQSNQIEIEIAGAKLTLRGNIDAKQLRLVLACLARR
jgi:transposase-like protein